MDATDALAELWSHFAKLKPDGEPIANFAMQNREENIEMLKEVGLALRDLPDDAKRKIRIVMNYDTEFPWIDVAVFELHERVL